MNIFENAREFVDLDNRRFRKKQSTTVESLSHKLLAQLPPSLIENKTILDLGSCLGAAGYHALLYGARSYTGVEIQNYYFETSKHLLTKYCKNNWEVIQKDIIEFLDIVIAEGRKFDYVLAAGVIYGFVNIVGLLEKISKVTKEYIVIDTFTVHVTTKEENTGIILITNQSMAKGVDSETYDYYDGIGSRIDLKALDIVMSTLSFNRTEDIIFPKKIVDTYDAYNDNDSEYFHYIAKVDYSAPIRYIVRYEKTITKTKTTQQTIIDDVKVHNNQWVFDEEVAKRFQHEAITNIPFYNEVIDFCVMFAKKHLKSNDKIIDVGSALGYTMSKFIDAGFTNVLGVDNSPAMNNNNPHNVICSEVLPKDSYKLILMNWTLHFINEKEKYLQDIYNNLDNGYFILTDKCTQSDIVKNLYYDFKRSKGVSEDYIKQKEQSLKGVMKSVPVDYYLQTLRNIGFTVDIVYCKLGFTTFLCLK